jgi:hypothetical protein
MFLAFLQPAVTLPVSPGVAALDYQFIHGSAPAPGKRMMLFIGTTRTI